MATGFLKVFDAARTTRMTASCSARVPWEKLRRITSTPASISWRITATELLAGPNVHTIFVFRFMTD